MEKSTDEELLAILKKDGIAIEKTADAIANAMKNGLLCFAKFDTLHGAYGFDRVTHYLQLPTIEVLVFILHLAAKSKGYPCSK